VIFIVCLIVSFFLPGPWNVVLIVCGVILEIGEVVWGLRLARGRAKTGVEAMIGRSAKVVEPCRPHGKVRVRGELWNAVCAEGAGVGDTVTILGQRDLELEVELAQSRRGRRSSSESKAAG
jgi:membrane protein implicated in regulation of membrane protease activity